MWFGTQALLAVISDLAAQQYLLYSHSLFQGRFARRGTLLGVAYTSSCQQLTTAEEICWS